MAGNGRSNCKEPRGRPRKTGAVICVPKGGGRLVKGSQEAKDRMAELRAMRGKKSTPAPRTYGNTPLSKQSGGGMTAAQKKAYEAMKKKLGPLPSLGM